MKPPNYPEQPSHLWEHFYRLSQIPRPSKEEAVVRQYVIDTAEQLGHSWRMDETGNLVILVPASDSVNSSGTVTIQNHLDMVTVKTEDSAHNFFTDPLQLQVNEGWLSAVKTTLGADNGVGCAAALALMTDPELEHPSLELLFTVDEETGLGGALNLDADMLSGTRMLNLDTEDWQELFIGCAGGGGRHFDRSFQTLSVPDSHDLWQLTIRGLAGGHSGIQIHQQLGNAIKLLGQFLTELLSELVELRIALFDAGVAHNVIPREGRVVFSCPRGGSEEKLSHLLEDFTARSLSYLPPEDAALELQLERGAAPGVLSSDDSVSLLDLIAIFPHGAQSYSLEQPADLVDTSINLAILKLDKGELFVESSYRFFNEPQSQEMQHAMAGLARAFELNVESVVGYPGWQPDFSSALLAQAISLHEEMFACTPAVKAIHAGLECGILKSKKPETDILSFGPTIKGAHSPTERLEIATVAPFWSFLTALLARM